MIARCALVCLALASFACSSESPPAVDAPINKPVTELERSAALGDISTLSPELQRAFDVTDHEPKRTPRANEWLDTHHEPGQTFAQHQHGRFPVPDETRRVIYFLPLGALSEDVPTPATLARVAGTFFGLEARVLPTLPLEEVVARRRGITPMGQFAQLQATDVLQWLAPRLPADAQVLIAVTMMDLYPDDDKWFVFGLASLESRVAIQSFARFDPEFYGTNRKPDWKHVLLDRSAVTTIHELGHTFGLKHCIYYECVFAGVSSNPELDRRPKHACPVCTRKLHSALGFDPAVREEQLAEMFGALGFAEEAAWSKRRATWIRTGAR